MLESLGCRFFVSVASCAVVVLGDGGQVNFRHVHIGSTEAERNGIIDALVCRHNF